MVRAASEMLAYTRYRGLLFLVLVAVVSTEAERAPFDRPPNGGEFAEHATPSAATTEPTASYEAITAAPLPVYGQSEEHQILNNIHEKIEIVNGWISQVPVSVVSRIITLGSGLALLTRRRAALRLLLAVGVFVATSRFVHDAVQSLPMTLVAKEVLTPAVAILAFASSLAVHQMYRLFLATFCAAASSSALAYGAERGGFRIDWGGSTAPAMAAAGIAGALLIPPVAEHLVSASLGAALLACFAGYAALGLDACDPATIPIASDLSLQGLQASIAWLLGAITENGTVFALFVILSLRALRESLPARIRAWRIAKGGTNNAAAMDGIMLDIPQSNATKEDTPCTPTAAAEDQERNGLAPPGSPPPSRRIPSQPKRQTVEPNEVSDATLPATLQPRNIDISQPESYGDVLLRLERAEQRTVELEKRIFLSHGKAPKQAFSQWSRRFQYFLRVELWLIAIAGTLAASHSSLQWAAREVGSLPWGSSTAFASLAFSRALHALAECGDFLARQSVFLEIRFPIAATVGAYAAIITLKRCSPATTWAPVAVSAIVASVAGNYLLTLCEIHGWRIIQSNFAVSYGPSAAAALVLLISSTGVLFLIASDE